MDRKNEQNIADVIRGKGWLCKKGIFSENSDWRYSNAEPQTLNLYDEKWLVRLEFDDTRSFIWALKSLRERVSNFDQNRALRLQTGPQKKKKYRHDVLFYSLTNVTYISDITEGINRKEYFLNTKL